MIAGNAGPNWRRGIGMMGGWMCLLGVIRWVMFSMSGFEFGFGRFKTCDLWLKKPKERKKECVCARLLVE